MNTEYALVVKPNECICVGCYTVTQMGLCYTGRIYKEDNFIQVEETEISFDATGKMIEETVMKTRCIPSFARGWICPKCASDYRNREVKHRDGSISFEPRVKIDRSPTSSTTLNPGWSYFDQVSDVEEKVDYNLCVVPQEVDRQGYKAATQGITKPRNGFEQVVLREKVDRAKAKLKR